MKEMQKNQINPYEEEVPQKTFDSVPVAPEDIEKLQGCFYFDDLSGGLQNVQVSDEELERQNEQWEYAKSFIDMRDLRNVPCYQTDLVSFKLTPEQLVVLKQSLEVLSLNMSDVNYFKCELKHESLYQQQSYIRLLHDIVDKTLDDYAYSRPYSPFLPSWLKKIGKYDVEKTI